MGPQFCYTNTAIIISQENLPKSDEIRTNCNDICIGAYNRQEEAYIIRSSDIAEDHENYNQRIEAERKSRKKPKRNDRCVVNYRPSNLDTTQRSEINKMSATFAEQIEKERRRCTNDTQKHLGSCSMPTENGSWKEIDQPNEGTQHRDYFEWDEDKFIEKTVVNDPQEPFEFENIDNNFSGDSSHEDVWRDGELLEVFGEYNTSTMNTPRCDFEQV